MAMELGIFTQYIRADSVEGLAAKVREYGLSHVVLDTYPGLQMDFGRVDAAVCRRIRKAFENEGVRIAALGGYVNFIHPDAGERRTVRRQFEGMIRVCGEIGIPMICSEAGSYHPTGYLWDPANGTEQVFDLAVEIIRPLAEEAERHGITLCLEPYVMSMAYSPARMERLIQAIGRKYVKIVADPAGLLTRATLSPEAQASVVADAFERLGPHIGLVHVQDCRPAPEWNDHFEWLGAGKGLLDYGLFMKLLMRTGYDGPLILEFLAEQDIAGCAAYVKQHWEKARSRTGIA